MKANNIQKTRETLRELRDNLYIHLMASPMFGGDHCEINAPEVKAMIEEADVALAIPPRNCDRYPDFNDAITTLAKKRGWTGTKWDSERYCILANWLLAPVDEGDEA